MHAENIAQILEAIKNQEISVEEGLAQLRDLPYADLGFARVDHHRQLRQKQAEVIYGQGKTAAQVIAITQNLREKDSRALATRITPETARQVQAAIPDCRYDEVSRLLQCPADIQHETKLSKKYYATVVTAGTADMPVAEEAAQTLEYFNIPLERVYDVGVAGIHRLLDQRHVLVSASVVISVAGMEGALTSVVGGLVSCPVIGVPTSVGYGASFDGLAALLAMLNSCASGVAVVNIDNGFGAAVMAAKIIRQLNDGARQ